MRVGDVMTRRVVRLRPGDTVRDALRAFSINRITGAPVVDHRNRVIGILTEMDILRRLEIGSVEISCPPSQSPLGPQEDGDGPFLRLISLSEALKRVERLPVSRLMTSRVVTVRPEDPVEEKMTLMIHRRIRRLPVVDGRGALVGIISRKDLIQALYKAAAAGGGVRGKGRRGSGQRGRGVRAGSRRGGGSARRGGRG
ncbi:MAG: CBS domain-containing protein [Thermoplasmatota archaeon]